MRGWTTKGACLSIIILIWTLSGITPAPLLMSVPSVKTVSAEPNVPYTVGNWTYISKPVLPIQINASQIPIGSDWTYVFRLEQGRAYRVYCYGDWINDETDSNKTDYDIFVYDPAGKLESYHTEAAGLPEHLGTTVDHPFFVPKQSGDYSFQIKNDARESNGAEAATFMVIEHIETDKWYKLDMEGKVDDEPVEKTAWAYEFNTTKNHIDVIVKVPDTLDMYEARLYLMANPEANVGTILNGVPLSLEEGLYSKTSGIYGGYNLDSEGTRVNNAMASCEYPGQDMLINYTVPVEGNVLYHLAFIAEYEAGTIEFMVKTDFEAPELTLVDPIQKVNPNNETTINVHVNEEFTLKTINLKYSTDNGTKYATKDMVAYPNSTYNATVPGQPAGTLVKYTILAQDISGNTAELESSYPVKNFANITLEVSDLVAKFGENITVSGSTPVSGANLTVIYGMLNASAVNGTTLEKALTNGTIINYTANGSILSRNVTTDSSGNFLDEQTMNRTGTWLIWATWNGSETYFEAASNYRNVTTQQMYITVTCNTSQSVTIGENITVTGTIDPRIENISVNVLFTSSNETVTKTALTTKNGTYTVEFQPTTMEMWQVYTHIEGNASISPAYSNTTTFTVNDTFLNQYLIYIIGGAGGAGGVGAVIFIRKRREEYE